MGDDEARARATLNEMQFRISEGPYTALGILETASADEVRSAFLELTKQYHPARFGRMSTEIQRLSNEVFLGIKGAHDQLMKMLGGGRRSAVGQSGAMPAVRPDATGRVPTGQNPPLGRPPAPSAAITRGTDRPSTPVVSRTTTPTGSPPTRPSTPPGGMPATSRAPTPSQGMPPQARPVTPQPVRPTTPTPAAARTTTPPMGTPIQRPTTPVGARPVTPPVSRPGTPPTAARPGSPPAAASYNPETIRHSGVPAFDERTAHREAMIQLNEQDWTNARQTLQGLAQHRPQSKNYGALLAYARGREAQKLGRASEAALEYQRALELEPDLAMAKQALAEVRRR